MDISIDNTVFSRLAEDPDVLVRALIAKVLQERCRLVVSTTVLHESFSDSNHERAAGRARMFSYTAEKLGSRLVVAGGVGDLIEAERAAVLSSTPSLPAKDRQMLLESLRSPNLAAHLPILLSEFRRSLHKDSTYASDLKVRAAGAVRFPDFEAKDLDAILNLRSGEFFWESPFIEQATGHGRFRQAVRERPRRHRATVTVAAYTFLNGIGSLFGDAAIAACAAYSKVFLTEDEGQGKRASYVWQQFGYPTAAMALRSWLDNVAVLGGIDSE
jgi:hypothetical protein